MQKLMVSEGVSLRCEGDAITISLGKAVRRLVVGEVVARLLSRLSDEALGLDELGAGLIGSPDGMHRLAALTATVRNLLTVGVLSQAAFVDEFIVATLGKKGRLHWQEGSPPDSAVIDPRVVATSQGDWVLLDSGLARGLVRVRPTVAGLVLSGQELAPGERLAPLRDLLWQAALLAPKETLESMESSMWDPVELLMMERSNDAAANIHYGATYRYLETCPPPPRIEEIQRDEVIQLPEPDPDRWYREDAPFSAVTEQRRSVSSFSEDEAPTLKQLAGVLHRSARIQHQFLDDKGVEVSRRPVAAGGALHETDLYVAVNRAEGLEEGLWRYNPQDNTIERFHCLRNPSLLLSEAAASLWGKESPPIVIIAVARFARVFWKYEGVGASLILKNVGVLLHALQLAAVAEGLGSCPLGSNSARLFEEVTGLGFPSHSPVGQLVLGVKQKEQPS